MRQVLGECYSSSSEGLDKVPSALNRLTGPSYGIADILRSGQEHEQSNGKMSLDLNSDQLIILHSFHVFRSDQERISEQNVGVFVS